MHVFIYKKPYTLRYGTFHEIFEVGIYIQKAWHFALREVFIYKKQDTSEKARQFAIHLYTKIRHFALLPWMGSWSLLMSTNFLCEFNVRLTLSVVTWPLFWRAQFVELRLRINTMYRLWGISLYSFSYGRYPELREKCQFKRQVTRFIFEIIKEKWVYWWTIDAAVNWKCILTFVSELSERNGPWW